MSTNLQKRLQALEDNRIGEGAVFIVLGYSDVDRLDKRALHPKSKIITVSVLGRPEKTKEIEIAIQRKLDALRRGDESPLFNSCTETKVKEWAK